MDFRIDSQGSFVQLKVEGRFDLDLLANYIRFAIKERKHTTPARLMLDLRGLGGLVPSAVQTIANLSADLFSHFPSSDGAARVAIVRNAFFSIDHREPEDSGYVTTCNGTPVLTTSDYQKALAWICDNPTC